MDTQTLSSTGTARTVTARARDWSFALRALLFPLLLAGSLWVGGCDTTGGGGPASTPGDSTPQETETAQPDQTLEPGGTAHSGDVTYMAPQGGLDSLVSISASQAPDPTAETPLPETAGAVGGFYRVSGGRTLDMPVEEAPLYLALPVPEGADPTSLALAVRVPRETVVGSPPSAPPYGWDLLRGAYAPEHGRLVVPLRFMMREGVVVSVLESSSHEAPSMAETGGETLFEKTKNFFGGEAKSRTSAATASPVRTAAQAKASPGDFEVKCNGFQDGGCGADEKKDVSQYLSEVYGEWAGGFREPDLRKTFGFNADYIWVIKEDGDNWCKGSTAGKYLSLTNTAITCYDGSGDPSKSTTRHEFFHAMQWNYAPISWPKAKNTRRDWVIEGNAELAAPTSSGASKKAIRDGGRNLRKVDVPLTSEGAAYRTQDFWVYMINERGSTPSKILDPLYQAQPGIGNGINAMKVHAMYSLPDDHWGWVRNQAFESRVKAGNGDLNDQCVFNPAATGSVKTVTYDAEKQDEPKTLTLKPKNLAARVVKVVIKNTHSTYEMRAHVTAKTSAKHSFAKAYGNYSSSTSECLGNPSKDGSAYIERHLYPGDQETVYLLLSDSNLLKSRASFDLEIMHCVSARDGHHGGCFD